MTCSGVIDAGALARSAVVSVATADASTRRAWFTALYYLITLGMPLALVCGICWASSWSNYGRK